MYAGNAIGSFIAPVIFSKFPAKWIIVVCVILNAASLLVFPIANIFVIISISRILVGIF